MTESTERAGRRAGRDALAGGASALVGVLIAVAPHLATWARDGTLEYVADGDDLLYLAVSRAPYYGEPALRDAYMGRWEGAPTLYAWAMFAPAARLTRRLGLPLVLTGLVWRVLGGGLFGASLYALFRRLLAGTARPTAWALGCALVGLADAGLLGGRSLVANLAFLPHFARGTTPMPKPDALQQYRVVTPLLNFPFLLLLVTALLPAGRRPARDAALGIAMLGLCTLTYFFFWTAAVAGLALYVGLLLLRALRPARRAPALRQAGLAALVAAGGLTLGMPQVYSNARTFRAPQYRPLLERAYVPHHLAPGDPAARWNVRNVWLGGKLAVGAAGVLALHIPGLGLAWCLSLAGYLLANSALVTGLEFENFHWLIVANIMGEVVLLATLAVALDRLPGPARRRLPAAWLVPATLLGLALAWRPYEALTAPEAAWIRRTMRALQPLRPSLAGLGVDAALAGPNEATVAALYGRSAVLYCSPYTWGALVPERVVHEHHALNGWLRGLEASAYERAAGRDTNNKLFPNPKWSEPAVAAARAAIFRRLEERPDPALLERYRPAYLLLPTAAPRPRRGGPWRLVQAGPAWSLWARRAAGAAVTGAGAGRKVVPGPPGPGSGAGRREGRP